MLVAADRLDRPGPYQLQAAITWEHARAADPVATNWHRIADLYATLAAITRSPVVELNRAVAVAMAEGPAAGLALVDRLAGGRVLDGYQHLHATRADLLRRLGRLDEAAAAYRRALALADNRPSGELLGRRLAEVGAEGAQATE